MKSFRLHRPKKRKGKGFQAIYKRKLTWKETISKCWNKFIFIPLLMGIFFLILTVFILTTGRGRHTEPIIEFQTLINFIKSFF